MFTKIVLFAIDTSYLLWLINRHFSISVLENEGQENEVDMIQVPTYEDTVFM